MVYGGLIVHTYEAADGITAGHIHSNQAHILDSGTVCITEWGDFIRYWPVDVQIINSFVIPVESAGEIIRIISGDIFRGLPLG